MSLRWSQLGINRPTSWTSGLNTQAQDDSESAGPKTAPSRFNTSGENNENDGQTLIDTMSGFAPQQPDRDRQRDWSGRRAAPPPLPLHERSASEGNRLTDIRIVPYSPPRLDSQQEALQGTLQLPASGTASGSPSGSPRRRRRQRRRRSKDRDGNGSDDSDQTTTTVTSRRTSRPTSWASRGSWGPSTVLAGAGASGSPSGSPAPGSPGSKASSSRTVLVGGGTKTSKGRNEGHAVQSVLSEKSRNSVMGGGKWANATKSGNDGKLDKEGYAGNGPGSALSTPVESVFPLARGGRKGVSGTKLASPTGSLFTTATTTIIPSATSDTPASSASTAKNTNIIGVNATSRLLAHSQHQPQLQHQLWQSKPQQGGHDSFYGPDSDDAAPPAPHAQLGLTPASASFSAAAANYLTEHRSASGAPQLQLPTSPSSPIVFSTSPTTTSSTATLQDRSSLSPFTPSPGSSTVHLPADHIVPAEPLFPSAAAEASSTAVSGNSGVSNNASPWNYRLAGGLRKVPKTPDFKRKGKGRALASTSSPYSQKHHAVVSGLDVSILPPLSELSSSPTTTIVAGGPAIGSNARAFASRPQRKTSFASDQSAGALSTDSALSFTASTVSANTNYKVYAHSSSPAGAASTSIALESTDSFGLPPSSSHSTNIEILGVSSPAAPPLPTLQRSDDPNQTFASLASYPSIASFDTGISENSAANFVVIGASSPPAPSRYLDHIRNNEADSFVADTDIPSSPPLPPRSATTTTSTFGTNDSDPNYVLHGEPSTISLPPQSSSSNASSLVTISRQPRPAYSQESLIVPPLKTVRAKRSNERFGYYKSRSRESLRRAASIKSISSLFGQEAASTFFAGQAFLNLDIPPIPVFTGNKASLKAQHQLPAFSNKPLLPKLKRKPLPLPAPPVQSENYIVYDRTPKKKTDGSSSSDVWDSPLSSQLTSSPRSPSLPQQPKQYKQATVQMVEEHPHQWSSQLSTVMSESEVDSIDLRSVSRSVSAMSGAPSGSYIRGDVSAASGPSARRSSTGWASSTHSRNMPSISSSLGLQMDELRERNSRSDSLLLDRPNPAYFRTSSASPATSGSAAPPPPPIRTVRDHDEHGDGLADLQDIGRQPSRSGLSGFFSSNNGSARNLHSSGSMRSVASGGFPSWARVYYGSGEHRPLSVDPSMSDLGQGDDYMSGVARPNSAFRRTPSLDNMHFNIFNTRRRPREVQPAGPRPFSDTAEMEAGEAGVMQDYRLRPPGLRKMTSSIWSPHLRVDRRATRFSVWEPPSVTWSTDTSSAFDRRNLQVICFTFGFIFPFAWMIAAFLPLPLDPQRAMEKRAEGEFGVPAALKRRIAQYDEMRYQSARWWRTLNRVMSVFGLLILGAVAALVVVGVHQGWGQ
ncbi:hypothetical protein SEUCBS139899_003455 [Sporothrix eucalyptigena]